MQGSPKTFAFANFKFTTSGASKIAFKSENPEFKFLDLKVSQSLFVNIYQRHTVLNVISDRRQFTLKSESELLLLVQLGLRRQSQRSSWGKRRSSDQSSGFRYDAVLPPSDPSSFTFPL